MGIVYVATNLMNGKQYVGKTLTTLENRRSGHCSGAARGHRTVFSAALRKYGPGGFLWETLFEADDNDELCREEMKFIAERKSRLPTGYNMTDGGEGFRGNHTARTKKRLSEFNRGKVLSPEHRLKISEAKKGRPGIPMSSEQIEKIRRRMLGRVLTDDWKRKIGDSNRGRKTTNESRSKISAAKKGKPLGPQTEQHKLNVLLSHWRRRISHWMDLGIRD